MQIQKQQQKITEIQENTLIVSEYNNKIELIKGIHKECDEFVNSILLSIVCISTLIWGIYKQNYQLVWSFSCFSIASMLQTIWIRRMYLKGKG